MKKYGILLLVTVILMILIPLPNLTRGSRHRNEPENEAADAFDGETFLVLDKDSGEVIELSERDFVIGTVSCEMPPSYHEEALKAQAVATYTYYSVKRAETRSATEPDKTLKGADFSDVPSLFPDGYTKEGMVERWGDHAQAYYDKIAQAVDEVLGQKICYDGMPIRALYHAISFGTTETAVNVWGGDYPYLQSVPSPGDLTAPQYETTVTVTEDDFKTTMLSLDDGLSFDGAADSWIGERTCSDTGMVRTVTVAGKPFKGTDMRTAFSLRSACFTVAYAEGAFTFTVHGYGHGVGMSQYGANYLAGQGADYREILSFYYTDVEIRI